MILRAVSAVLATSLALAPSPTPGGDGLSQSLSPDQAEATGAAVLQQGHVDIGPRLRDGTWTIQIHDDAAAPPVWRQPEEAVFRIADNAVQQIPDDDAYAFLGQPPGTDVHVVPQTQQDGIVWIGWNTQDPAVMQAISRGVTMNLRAVQGPGPVAVYLQAGNLGAPQVLWNSAAAYPQPIWVETNTHTHASWVFGKPGVYLLAVTVSADLADGSTVSDDVSLRFAVGDGTDPQAALDAQFDTPPAALPAASASPVAAAADEDASPNWLIPVLGAGAVLLVLALVAVPLRARSVRRRAEQQHAQDTP